MLKQLFKKNRQTISRLGGLGAAFYLKHNLTWLDVRVAHYDLTVDPGRPEYNEHCIFVFWHEYIVLAVGHWANTPVTMLVSQHRDADWLTDSAEFLGFNYVRGSTTRGGTAAIRQLKHQSKTRSIGITPDGPRGPRREMAMGPVFLASMLKMPIVPVGFGYDRPWRLNTWDQFAVPKPFSRARIIMGPKIYIEPRVSRDKMEKYNRQVRQLTTDLTTYAEDWAETGKVYRCEQAADRFRDSRKLMFNRRDDDPKAEDKRGVEFPAKRRAA